MYKFINGKDIQMMVMSVAPPSDKELHHQLRDLSVSHLLTAQGSKFSQFNGTIESLDSSQTDKARLQFLHAIQQITEKVEEDSKRLEFDIAKYSSWRETVIGFVNNLQLEVGDLQKKCENNPNNKKRVKALNFATGVLFEGLQCIQSFTQSPELDIEKILNTQKSLNDNHKRLKEIIGLVYDNIKNNLSSIEELKTQATTSLKQQALSTVEMNFSKIERLGIEMGDRKDLWIIAQNKEEKAKAIKEGIYIPINEKESENIKKSMIKLFSSFDNYNGSGIIGSLKALSVMSEYQAFKTISKTDKFTTEQSYEKKVASHAKLNERLRIPKNEQKPLAEKEILIKRIREDKEFLNEYGAGFLRISNDLKEGVKFLSQQLGVEINQRPLLTLVTDKENVIGTWNDSSNEKVIIYKDIENKNISENAVFMMKLNAEDLKSGIPELTEELRKKYWNTSSNFMSLGAALIELKDENIQNHMFKKVFDIKDETLIPRTVGIMPNKMKIK